MFTLQLPHSASSLLCTSGTLRVLGQSRADDPQSWGGDCKVQLPARRKCDGLTGAILGCFVSCRSFIHSPKLKFLVSFLQILFSSKRKLS